VISKNVYLYKFIIATHIMVYFYSNIFVNLHAEDKAKLVNSVQELLLLTAQSLLRCSQAQTCCYPDQLLQDTGAPTHKKGPPFCVIW
jgi:hypothetical protein